MEFTVILGVNMVAIIAIFIIIRRQNNSSQNIQDLQNHILELSKTNTAQSEQLKSREAKIIELEEQIISLKSSETHFEERIKREFKLISHQIIEESREKVNEFNVNRLSDLMQPFAKEMKEFKEQMHITTREQSKERIELETRIKQMVEISKGMSKEAQNLSNALRGNNKAAGNWGESILENILQNSGLTPGKEGYELQSMLRDEHGNPYTNDCGKKMIPDAIIYFPDNRKVIIDSKVSIAAFTDSCNADSEEEKKQFLKAHLDSIKNHIKGLSVKNYESYVNGSLDFVMMFIPNDYAAMTALQSDLSLWQTAYDKKILIISPTNLITSLKIVSDLWTREKQQQNVAKILERGIQLHTKCCAFVETFQKVGEELQSATTAYQKAFGQLEGNGGVIRQAEMLEELGVKGKKRLGLKSAEKSLERM